jgi:hypothetical protein
VKKILRRRSGVLNAFAKTDSNTFFSYFNSVVLVRAT